MTTLIEVRNSRGLVGRCDAKCYEAEHPHCDCICGGANHGAGLAQATSNTRELAQEWIDAWKTKHPEAASFEVPDEIHQIELL
jgi:hypothetical protein